MSCYECCHLDDVEAGAHGCASSDADPDQVAVILADRHAAARHHHPSTTTHIDISTSTSKYIDISTYLLVLHYYEHIVT